MKYHTNIHNVICDSIISEPIFYLFPDFESSKIRVLDRLFNVLGTGYYWADNNGYMVASHHKKYKPYRKERKRNIDNLFKTTYVFVEMFSEFSDNKSKKFLIPEDEFSSHEKYSEFMKEVREYKGIIKKKNEMIKNYKSLNWEEKQELLELEDCAPKVRITYNVAQSNIDRVLQYRIHDNELLFKYCGFVPYSYFSKKYSSVWDPKAKYIKPDWKEDAIWFYAECLEFFNNPNRVKYYGYYPTERRKLNFEEYIKREYLDKGASIQKINDDYETKCFDGGNFNEFSMERWDTELNRTIEFINKTLDMLNHL